MTSKQKAQDCIGFLVDYLSQGAADSQQHEHSDTTLSCSTQAVNAAFVKIIMFSFHNILPEIHFKLFLTQLLSFPEAIITL